MGRLVVLDDDRQAAPVEPLAAAPERRSQQRQHRRGDARPRRFLRHPAREGLEVAVIEQVGQRKLGSRESRGGV
jgi:hypothetical protein